MICSWFVGVSTVVPWPNARSYLDPLLVATVAYQVRDDLRQIVLERLLSCTEGSRPSLSEYSDRASLRTWLRVVVKRCSLNLERELDGKVRRDSSEQLEKRLVSVAANPELDYLKARYADEFRISPTEFESVVKCVISSLDLTLSGLERAPEAHA